MTITDKPVTGVHPEWNFNMDEAPLGGKLMALNPGNVAVFATLTRSNIKHFRAWCALPKIPKEHK